MSTQNTAVFEHITLPADALTYALVKDAKGLDYNWRKAYPVLAELDTMQMHRSATIFADDCPNNAHDAFILEQLGLPLDTGTALMKAVAYNIPEAQKDLADKTFAQWFCLDPVHWRAGRDHVNLIAFKPNEVTYAETKELLSVITPWLAEFGWHLHIANTNEWFVRTMTTFDYHAPCLSLAQSGQLESFLPIGRDLKRWQTLLTEIQMSWFEHPVNQARTAKRQLEINSLWLYGGTQARALSTENVALFNIMSQQIFKPNPAEVTNIHIHLAWLNHYLAPILEYVKTEGQSIIGFLGENWQQDVVITPSSLGARLKNRFSSNKKKALIWLEEPNFEFLNKKL